MFAQLMADCPQFFYDDVRMLRDRYGVRRFKLVGRGVVSSMNLESYLYYLVRPEHRDGLRQAIQQMGV